MKISQYHKQQGNNVDWYSPLFDNPDLVYQAKVFDFTGDYQYTPQDCEVVRGGSGYSLDNKLPQEIEKCQPDYSIYDCDYAMGFTTRGCVRSCDFCIVPQKEGKIRKQNTFRKIKRKA